MSSVKSVVLSSIQITAHRTHYSQDDLSTDCGSIFARRSGRQKEGKKDGGNKMDSNSDSIFEGNQMNEFPRVEQTDGDARDFLFPFSLFLDAFSRLCKR